MITGGDHGVQSVKVGCGSVQLVASSEKSWQYFTLLTSHEDKSWLKAMAWENMEFICVTFEVSQSPMGSLKASARYIAARDGRPCGVSGYLGAWGRATTTTQRC
jgi:hypothetical protein